VKFKLDENLSPSLATLFAAAGHEAHSVVKQSLGGKPDPQVIEVCAQEQRALITFDLDFSNIQAYPPHRYAGIAVLRLNSQAHQVAAAAVERILALLPHERLVGTLWIIEEDRVRIRE
jgi:predicted nuclease of predicted toxin-antitoxin system